MSTEKPPTTTATALLKEFRARLASEPTVTAQVRANGIDELIAEIQKGKDQGTITNDQIDEPSPDDNSRIQALVRFFKEVDPSRERVDLPNDEAPPIQGPELELRRLGTYMGTLGSTPPRRTLPQAAIQPAPSRPAGPGLHGGIRRGL